MLTDRKYPEELQKLPIWVLWKLEEHDGRETKVPYSALYDGRASSTNPDTWTTFQKAMDVYKANPNKYSGLGIVLSKEYRIVFVDVDHCARKMDVDGNRYQILSDAAIDILNHFRLQYAEISQSGTGLHILTMGTIPKSFKNSLNGVEIYDTARFCAMTGNALAVVPSVDKYSILSINAASTRIISDEQSGLDYVYATYKPEEKLQHRTDYRLPSEKPSLSDSKIIEKMLNHGKRVPLLYAGQWESAGYGSQSEADCALCTAIAFWCERDADTIDRIFRTSALYRSKWEKRADYRDWTISAASAACTETLSEFIRRREAEFERDFLEYW